MMGGKERETGKLPDVQGDQLPRGGFVEQVWGMACPLKESKVK